MLPTEIRLITRAHSVVKGRLHQNLTTLQIVGEAAKR